jgi:hypothetical protein
MKRRNRISGQWSPRLIEMLESPAYRVLSRAAHQIISRVEIELAHHGGNENGKLPVTAEQFIEYGVHHGSVAPAIREAEALGFIRVTEHGRGGNAEHHAPNKFFLTFAHSRDSRSLPPPHDWRQINTVEEAEQIARAARAAKDERAVARGKQSWRRRQQQPLPAQQRGVASVATKSKPDTGFRAVSTPETGIETAATPIPETGDTGSLRKPAIPLYLGAGERPIYVSPERRDSIQQSDDANPDHGRRMVSAVAPGNGDAAEPMVGDGHQSAK